MIIHAYMWDVYMNDKKAIIKSGYYVELAGSDGNKVIWELIDNHDVEEAKKNEYIRIRGFDFNLLNQDEEGVVREGFSDYLYLLMFMNLWPGYQRNNLESMDMNVDE